MAWAVVSTLDSPTSGTFIFTGLTLSTYKCVQLRMAGITVTTDGTDVRVTWYVGGSEVTSTYSWLGMAQSSGGTANADQAASQASALLVANDANWDTGNAGTKSFGAVVTLHSPASTALYKRSQSIASHVGPTTNVIVSTFCQQMDNAGAVDGVKVGGTSNLTAGKVRILGLA